MRRFYRPDIFAVATVLFALNALAARINLLGISAWQKSLVILAYGALTLAIGYTLTARITGMAPVIVSLKYALWIPFIILTSCFDHYSVAPRLLLLMFMAGAIAFDAHRIKSWVSRPALSIAAMLLCVVLIDLVWKPHPAKVILDKRPKVFFARDDLLGYKPLPDCEVKIECWHNGTSIYRIKYHFDGLSRRVVVDNNGKTQRQHAIFMGGSCVFGENINDSETLPSHFAAITDNYAVSNYAFSGYGPQHMLSLLSSNSLCNEIPQEDGVMLYGIIGDHIRRANGSYNVLSWGSDFPCFVTDHEDVVHVGSFADARPRTIAFFNLLRTSHSLDRMATALDSRLSLRRDGWSTFLDIVRSSKVEYLRQFRGRFYAFIWPGGGLEGLSDSLSARGVEVIDLADIGVPPPTGDQLVPFDVHPSGDYNVIVAKALLAAVRNAQSRGLGD